ncbi:MAG: TetR/AcrR family transcriptional regulator [Chloroflexota bacterium]
MSKEKASQASMTNSRKIDPRIERTQEALRGALMALIEEKGFDAISVQDVTERARLNRATFYLHYRDKQDLLLRTSEAVFDRLVAEAGPIDRDNLALQKPPQQLVMVFRHVAEHRDFYRVVLGRSGVPAFVARMREYVTTFTQPRIASLHTLYPTAVPILDEMFISEYVTGALLGIIIWWLENDLPHSPEYMADRFTWLSVAGTYRMLGIEPPSLDAE